jgi:hypothetical protein
MKDRIARAVSFIADPPEEFKPHVQHLGLGVNALILALISALFAKRRLNRHVAPHIGHKFTFAEVCTASQLVGWLAIAAGRGFEFGRQTSAEIHESHKNLQRIQREAKAT